MSHEQPGGSEAPISEEELRAQLEEELRRIRVEDVLLQTVVSLVNLGGQRLGLTEGTREMRDLGQVKTAIEGVRGPMICGIDFFGADHVVFASDCPFDKEKGPGYIRSTIAVLESLDLKPADREKISYKNAQALFGVK